MASAAKRRNASKNKKKKEKKKTAATVILNGNVDGGENTPLASQHIEPHQNPFTKDETTEPPPSNESFENQKMINGDDDEIKIVVQTESEVDNANLLKESVALNKVLIHDPQAATTQKPSLSSSIAETNLKNREVKVHPSATFSASKPEIQQCPENEPLLQHVGRLECKTSWMSCCGLFELFRSSS